MASSGAIKAGKAFVEIYADDSKLTRTLNQQSRNLKKFGAGLASVGAKMAGAGLAGIAAFGGASVAFAKAGDHLDKMAIRTGFSVQSLSQLGFAAEQSGTDIDSLENGLRGMARFSLNASRGLTTATDSLTDLGLSADDLKGKSPVDQFEMLAQKISEVEDPTKRAALSMSIFGKSGSKLLPLFAGGAEGIAALRKQADQLDLTMSPEDVKSAAALTDAMNVMKRSFNQIIVRVGGALAPTFTDLSLRIGEAFATASKFIRENKGLTKSIFFGVTAVAGLGGAFIAAGLGISLAGVVLGGFASLMGVLVSPIGLVVAGLAAAGAAVLYFTDTGSVLSDWISDLATEWTGAWDAIGTALKGGDVQGAFDVFTASLKVAWYETTDFLGNTLESALTSAWKTITDLLPQEWKTMILKMSDMFTAFMSSIDTGRTGIVNSLAEGYVRAKGSLTGASEDDIEFEVSQIANQDDFITTAIKKNKNGKSNLTNSLGAFLNGPEDTDNDKGPAEESAGLRNAKAELEKAMNAVAQAAEGPGDTPEEQNKKKKLYEGPEALSKKSGGSNATNKIASINTESELSSIANALSGESSHDVTEEQKKTNSKLGQMLLAQKREAKDRIAATKRQVQIEGMVL